MHAYVEIYFFPATRIHNDTQPVDIGSYRRVLSPSSSHLLWSSSLQRIRQGTVQQCLRSQLTLSSNRLTYETDLLKCILYINIYLYTCTYMYVDIYAHIHMCTYAYIYTCTYTRFKT